MGDFLRAEIAAGRTCLPAGPNVLRAFQQPFDDARVLIVGNQPQRAGTAQAALRTVAGRELKSAGTDARCQSQARLFDAVAAAQREAERTVLRAAKAEGDLARLREARVLAVSRASRSAAPPAGTPPPRSPLPAPRSPAG